MPDLQSLNSSLLTKEKGNKKVAYLIEADADGKPAAADNLNGGLSSLVPAHAFQYWPESLSDTKGTNYQRKEIPGGSLPLYQWINGSERLLTMTAVFTSDIDIVSATTPSSLGQQVNLDEDNKIVERIRSAGVSDRNADIRSAVAWLKQYTYPYYKSTSGPSAQLTIAPTKLILVMPNSGIGLAGMNATNPDQVVVVMTQCDVTYEAWFPSGLPRIATVALSFAEIGQVSGGIVFPGRNQDVVDVIDGKNQSVATSYSFQPVTKLK